MQQVMQHFKLPLWLESLFIQIIQYNDMKPPNLKSTGGHEAQDVLGNIFTFEKFNKKAKATFTKLSHSGKAKDCEHCSIFSFLNAKWP